MTESSGAAADAVSEGSGPSRSGGSSSVGYPGADASGVGMATLAAERTEVDVDVTTQNDPAGPAHGEDAAGDADLVVLDHTSHEGDVDRVHQEGSGLAADSEVPDAAGDPDVTVLATVEAVAEPVAGPVVEDVSAQRLTELGETDPAVAIDPATRELAIDDLLADADDLETDAVPLGVARGVAPPPATVAAAALPLMTDPVAPGFVDAPLRSQVRAARRLQARKVGRLVRHIELYSLLKVSLLFYTCMLIVGVVAGVLLWSMLQKSGAVSSVEGFIGEIFLLENFHLEGRQIFRIGVLGGMVGVVVLTLVTLVGGLLFNLISDLTGGIRVSVVELESARPVPSRHRRR